jgi:hypothetical protein
MPEFRKPPETNVVPVILMAETLATESAQP